MVYQFEDFKKNRRYCSEETRKEIEDFNPNLIITFNNQFWSNPEYLDIPRVVYDVDSINNYGDLINMEYLKNKFFFVTNQKAANEYIVDKIKVNRSRILYIKPFTGVKADSNINTSLNLAFLGSHWLWDDFKDILNFSKENLDSESRKYALYVLSEFKKNPFDPLENIYKEHNLVATSHLFFNDLKIASARLSGIKRLRYLTSVADLGLEIRGIKYNSNLLIAFPEILLSHSNEEVNNLETTQNFFNSSKIALNTNHYQAISGFSWRVCDILASNACLVSEYSRDFKSLGFNVPCFTNSYDLRKICKELLKNSEMRKEITEKCHEIIEKEHRVDNAIDAIESFTHLSLHSKSSGYVKNIVIRKNEPYTFINKGKALFPKIDKKNLSNIQRLYLRLSRHYFKKIFR